MTDPRIEPALAEIRPFLQADGGDIEFLSADPEHGVIEIRLTGACGHCALSIMTLRAGVERILLRALPEMSRVEAHFG
jgi:Fe-S cluster biogenesis protein NfuA